MSPVKSLRFLLMVPVMLVAADRVQVVEQKDDRIRLRITCEPPVLQAVPGKADLTVELPSKDRAFFFDSKGRLIPYQPVVLQFPYRRAQVRLITVQEERYKAIPPEPTAERPLIGDSTFQNGKTVHAAVDLAFIGEYNGNRLWSANVYPYFFDEAAGELVFRREVVFDVTAEEAALERLVPISLQEAELLDRIGAVGSRFKAQAVSAKALQKSRQENVERWKIIVNDEGLYRITGRDLQAAGVNLLAIDFKNLRLTCYGKDVSIYPSGWRDGQFEPDDYFEFWGEPNRKTYQQEAPDLYRDPFTDERVYWLSWEKRGLWMAEETGQITNLQPGSYSRPYSFLETIHVEKDAYYERLSTLEEDRLRDHWFFDSGISSGKKIEYPFTLVHPDLQSPLGVRARVMLRGRTTSMDIQHNISVFLNDSFLFSSTWKGQETADLISQPGSYVSASSLQNGVNRLSIVNNVEPQNYDFVMLNWFEITYPRLYRAYKNFIKFSIPPASPGGKFLFRVDGFTESGIEVYKLHQSKINGGVIEEVTDFSGYTSLQISFQNDVFSPDVEFVAVTESAKRKPLKIVKDQPTALKSENLAADYLIISHRRFMQSQALKDLIALRQSQGLMVLAVDAEDIYDEFNYGHVSSFAIKDFIKHAYLNWQSPKLEYVLLIGDGSYVRRTAEGDTLDLVPVHMRQTMSFGAAASDYWYTLLTGDDEIPEIAVGRLPVRTTEELERFIGKIIRYETNPPVGDWANRFLIIGGNGDDFRSQGIALSK
ncbi:MAG: C25 family cysteine peptidase, partial [candidate division KSB1 bacterium]|nr:C25 family cysteine peptidase [candidate division KSB1 bacterium]